MPKKLVYICSPLRGDIERNIIKAQGYCREAVELGVIPITPHVYFTQFLNDLIPEERKIGMELGIELLKKCDEVWVYGIQNPSEGMKAEIELAKELGIPVRDAAEVYQSPPRACRMIEEERAIHNRAVSIRKMTDAQLCEFVDRTYGRGMEEGAKLAETNTPKAPEKVVDGAACVKAFIEYLTGRVGTGNRIGNGTILQLNRELDAAKKAGMFRGEAQ